MSGQFELALHYRALAVERDSDIVRFWVSPHAEYNQLIGTR